jgi:hypothetical protein
MFEDNSELEPERVMEERRDAIKKNIRPISIDELRKLGGKLFPFQDHPWRAAYFTILDENPGAIFYHAASDDRVEFIYSPAINKGFWYIPSGAMGPLQEGGLKIMKAVTGK